MDPPPKDLFVDEKWDRVSARRKKQRDAANARRQRTSADEPTPTTLTRMSSSSSSETNADADAERLLFHNANPKQFIDLSLRRTVYGTLAGALIAATIFRECCRRRRPQPDNAARSRAAPVPPQNTTTGGPSTRSAAIAYGAGFGGGSAWQVCAKDVELLLLFGVGQGGAFSIARAKRERDTLTRLPQNKPNQHPTCSLRAFCRAGAAAAAGEQQAAEGRRPTRRHEMMKQDHTCPEKKQNALLFIV